MQIVRENEKRTIKPFDHVTIHEYDMHDTAIGGGVASIKGRYPASGFVFNQKCKELVYVLSGNGTLITPTGTIVFAKGDVLLIDQDEKYAWEGDMLLFMANTPPFDPAQHVTIA